MTSVSDAMGDRLRPLLKKLPVVEKKMFGGLGFMLAGNMLIGTTAKGDLLVRVDPAKMHDALTRTGAYEMHMGPRAMTGFVAVNTTGTATATQLADWVKYAHTYVKTLPAK